MTSKKPSQLPSDLHADDTRLGNLVLQNEKDGKEAQFEFLDLIYFDDEEYVVLLPVEAEDSKEPSEVVILKVASLSAEDKESYVSVKDQSVLNEVFGIFKEKFQAEFCFTDGE